MPRLQPIVTGASVIGLKYKDGVIVAADTLALGGPTSQMEKRGRVVCEEFLWLESGPNAVKQQFLTTSEAFAQDPSTSSDPQHRFQHPRHQQRAVCGVFLLALGWA